MTLGDRIRERRIELDWTQEELAKKMGYKSKSTINKIESGINDITQSKVVKFAEVLGVTASWLMGWEDNQVQIFGQEKWYYEDPELAKEAQRMFEDADMRSLFHMKKNMSSDRFQKHVDMMKEMYRLEHPEEDY